MNMYGSVMGSSDNKVDTIPNIDHVCIAFVFLIYKCVTCMNHTPLQFMKDRGDGKHRSAVSGKRIKMKVKKSSKDKEVRCMTIRLTTY